MLENFGHPAASSFTFGLGIVAHIHFLGQGNCLRKLFICILTHSHHIHFRAPYPQPRFFHFDPMSCCKICLIWWALPWQGNVLPAPPSPFKCKWLRTSHYHFATSPGLLTNPHPSHHESGRGQWESFSAWHSLLRHLLSWPIFWLSLLIFNLIPSVSVPSLMVRHVQHFRLNSREFSALRVTTWGDLVVVP